MILKIADLLGISVLRLGIYAACLALATGGALTIRQHYINKGYASAIAAVKKQDARTTAAANQIEQKAAKCQEGIKGYWDVITQGCKLEDAN